MWCKFNRKKGFTLIELVLSVGIIGIILTLIVIVINPIELRKQFRDRKRISELNTLEEAINLYRENLRGVSLGVTSTVYVSVPDPAIGIGTSTCTGMGLPSLQDNWSYYCSNPNDYRNIDGTGWLPFDFQSLAIGSVLSSLLVDPTNTTSSGFYYTYVPGGSFIVATTTTFVPRNRFVLTAAMESKKIREQAAITDNGTDAFRFETGDALRLWGDASGLLAYWSFEDGAGTILQDKSMNRHDGTLMNFAFSGNSNWTPDGKIGGALSFSGPISTGGNDDYVNVGDISELEGMSQLSVEAWAMPRDPTTLSAILDRSGDVYEFRYFSSKVRFVLETAGPCVAFRDSSVFSVPAWHHLVLTYDGSQLKAYVDGQNVGATSACSGNVNTVIGSMKIGWRGGTGYFNGVIDEVRIYNRALTADEILLHYEMSK